MHSLKRMLSAFEIRLLALIVTGSLITPSVRPVLAHKFWSPREIVLDTYTRPVPFRCGDEICLAYELHITNMDRYRVSLQRIEMFADGS